MLMEMARMSVRGRARDAAAPGQLPRSQHAACSTASAPTGRRHPGRHRVHAQPAPLLNAYGNDPRFTLRAVHAGRDDVLRASWRRWPATTPRCASGPPWWFHDTIEGMTRFRQLATETAGFYNTAGFNDDTRAFCSIPARHDLARRVDANIPRRAGHATRHRRSRGARDRRRSQRGARAKGVQTGGVTDSRTRTRDKGDREQVTRDSREERQERQGQGARRLAACRACPLSLASRLTAGVLVPCSAFPARFRPVCYQ